MYCLWPEANRRAASNRLRSTLYAARKVLDAAVGLRYLASEDESLVLLPGGNLWVDVDAFEEAARTARRYRDPEAYRIAIDLYAGDLLPENRYEAWAEDRRRELRQLYLALIIELARHHAERGEHEPAIEVLSMAITEEPTLEEAHASLMRLYAASGRPERAIAQYERLRETYSNKLGTHPSAATYRLRDEIAAGTSPQIEPSPKRPASQEKDAPVGADNHNLPAQRTSFVGRERELAEVKGALARTRLVTLTGMGGSGKTRLALEAARGLTGTYPDGVWFVELAGLSDSELLPSTVAEALGVPERPGQPLTDMLVDALRTKQTLLVLDNCEHLVAPAARLVDALLDSCPNLKILATSREGLRVAGEGFYVGTLGFELLVDNTWREGMRWSEVAPERSTTSLMLVTWSACMFPGMYRVIVMATDEIGVVHQELVSKGIDFELPPTQTPRGTQAMFRDPFGNALMLWEQAVARVRNVPAEGPALSLVEASGGVRSS